MVRRYPLWPHLWAGGCGAVVVVCVSGDGMARQAGINSFLAPSHAALWLSVGLGASLGAVGLAFTWLVPRSYREYYERYLDLPLSERLRWRHQKWNLLCSSWFILLLWGLLGWCWYSGVFVLPAVFAMNAVLFVATPAWALPRDRRGRPRWLDDTSGDAAGARSEASTDEVRDR